MTGKSGVVYLLKDRLQVYSPYLSSVVEFRFVPEIIRDLDVINKSLLESLIKVFVTNGKITPSSLIFVLSDNTYFVKDFVLPNQVQPAKPAAGQPQPPQLNVNMEGLKEAADKYIEHVPYDNVVSRSFPLKNGFRICAANQDFFESIKNAFEKVGFTVELVVPGLVLGNNLSAKPIMDGPMAMSALSRAGSLKQFDLLTQQIYAPTEKTEENGEEDHIEEIGNKKANKKRLFAMVGVLTLLIVLLVIVYVQSQAPATPPSQPAQAQTPVAAVKPASTVNAVVPTVASIAPTAGTAVLKTISIQIVNASASATTASALRADLVSQDFKSVTLQTQNGVSSSSTVVSFSQTVDSSVRNLILASVKKYKSNITVQDRQNPIADVSIIFGN